MYFVGSVLYYQLNIDYIIDTYCVNKDKPELKCNGKCHLAKQLQISNDNASDKQSSFNLVFEAFYPLFFQIHKAQSLIKLETSDTLNNWNYLIDLKHSYLYNCFQPPEYSA